MRPKPHVIENPMSVHHGRTGQVELEEPIYHSLEGEDEDGGHKTEDDGTVYINADLEVVYPSLPLPTDPLQPPRLTAGPLSEDEEELNGLLADCYENEESLLRQDYVPSPAPGSFPRAGGPVPGGSRHLSYHPQKPPLSFGQKKKCSNPGYLVWNVFVLSNKSSALAVLMLSAENAFWVKSLLMIGIPRSLLLSLPSLTTGPVCGTFARCTFVKPLHNSMDGKVWLQTFELNNPPLWYFDLAAF